jgi:hypothetical protein
MRTIFTLTCTFILSGCSTLTQTPDTPTPEQGRLGVSRSSLQGSEEVQLRRLAQTVTGSIKVNHGQDRVEIYQGHECTFGYERGKGVVHRNDRPYYFETISVAVMGRNANGDDFFDRVSYTNADYVTTFVNWDFTRDFGPIDLDSTLRFGHDDVKGSLRFERKGRMPSMELRHTDTYATSRSHYFRPGEKRDYTIRINFDRLDQERIAINSIDLEIHSAVRDRFGNYGPREQVTNIQCSKFIEVL